LVSWLSGVGTVVHIARNGINARRFSMRAVNNLETKLVNMPFCY
jgi:hypothetical protein